MSIECNIRYRHWFSLLPAAIYTLRSRLWLNVCNQRPAMYYRQIVLSATGRTKRSLSLGSHGMSCVATSAPWHSQLLCPDLQVAFSMAHQSWHEITHLSAA